MRQPSAPETNPPETNERMGNLQNWAVMANFRDVGGWSSSPTTGGRSLILSGTGYVCTDRDAVMITSIAMALQGGEREGLGT
jgi:hypothetical protein